MTEPSPSPDLFRQPLAQMIDLRHPLAVLADRLPWAQIEAVLAPQSCAIGACWPSTSAKSRSLS
jgi:hypothetical protein